MPYFIKIFYASVLDNRFCFFEHAAYWLIQEKKHLILFIEFTIILKRHL